MDISLRDALPVLAALAGAIVGGLVAELRALLQGGRDRRRALRMLLYQLLELRFRIATINPQQFLVALSSSLVKRFGIAATKTLSSPEVAEVMKQAVRIAAAAGVEPSLASQYEATVSELAPHDPILAYRLRDQSRLLDLDHHLKSYYDEIVTLPYLAADPETPTIRTQAEATTLELARADAINELADHIRTVAWKIGPTTRFRTSRALRRQATMPNPNLEQAIERILAAIPLAVQRPQGAA